MAATRNSTYIPIRQLLMITLTVALFIQLIIIGYNAATGYIQVPGLFNFIVRLVYATLLSTAMGLMVIFPDMYVIHFLNRRYPWNQTPFIRAFLQLPAAVLTALFVSSLGTLAAYLISPYTDNLPHVLLLNAMILSVINLPAMAALEAWVFFREGKLSKHKAEKLELELLKSRFEVLKTQINPHFLFNSLNVLSGLIYKDPARAEQFIEEFAGIYRYVIETIEKPVSTVAAELGFARSYIFLQQIRYGNTLSMEVKLDSTVLTQFIPSLSLQVVLENAIKHNVVDASNPLTIKICSENNQLVIVNNLKKKLSAYASTGLGLTNLTRRYAVLCDNKPQFFMQTEHYTVYLPLIKDAS